ncbi:MAG: PKD domain-containing protein [Isosphaeraceae bacterium]|nr:PKD domain-containing protein [Isosphaeraceae bacterium]
MTRRRDLGRNRSRLAQLGDWATRRVARSEFLDVSRLEDRVLLAVFTVTNDGDNGGTDPAPGAGTGTLRQAIVDANASGQPEPHRIEFNIGAPGRSTILLETPLPSIAREMEIDGTTEPSFDPGSGEPVIYLAGSLGTTSAMRISAADSIIRSLGFIAFTNTSAAALNVGATGIKIQGCWFGVESGGAFDARNHTSLRIDGGGDNAEFNIIGVDGDGIGDASEGNRFLSSDLSIDVVAGESNIIAGNTIGLLANGDAGVGVTGIRLFQGAQGNRIGTDADGVSDVLERNVVGGPTVGIEISGTGTNANRISGNFIGTDISGSAARAVDIGIRVADLARFNSIGSDGVGALDALEGNLIAGGNTVGVQIELADDNVVAGNTIGLAVDGVTPLPNLQGIQISSSARTTIGGISASQRNVISGNDNEGIFVGFSTATRIFGNRIGTDASGTAAAGNGVGISVLQSTDTTIGTDGDGGDDGAERNVVSANFGVGIAFARVNAARIAGNLIGLDVSGNALLGNMGGIDLLESDNVLIGVDEGGTADERNYIGSNLDFGIRIGELSDFNRISGNVIGTSVDGTVDAGNIGHAIILEDATSTRVGIEDPNGGNLIVNNRGWGIVVRGLNHASTTIVANSIGLAADGLSPGGNEDGGITVSNGASGVTIGGSGVSGRNYVAANSGPGIVLVGASTGASLIRNTWIGVDRDGSNTLPNDGPGIFLANSGDDVTIGGTVAGEGNLIGGNTQGGIRVDGSGIERTLIVGNSIGVRDDIDLGNGFFGIRLIGARDTVIGGDSTANPAVRNFIAFNQGNGIQIEGDGADHAIGTSIQGNRIGTDETGTLLAPNNGHGIALVDRASSTTIGGTDPGRGNLISGNALAGVAFMSNLVSNNWVLGNRIGTNADGSAALPNDRGVEMSGGTGSNTIGSNDDAFNDFLEGNLISGNLSSGVLIETLGSFNRVDANTIGLSATVDTALPNAIGILLRDGAVANSIGSTSSNPNIISGNLDAGIVIKGVGSRLNVFRANYIGLDGTGLVAVPNGDGVRIETGADTNTLDNGNFIAGNLGFGVLIRDLDSNGNVVFGNSIGVATDFRPQGNASGVVIENAASGNSVGFNRIAFNQTGIRVGGVDTRLNSISGNLIDQNVGPGVLVDRGSQATNVGPLNTINSNGATGVTFDGSGTSGFVLGNTIDGNAVAGVLLQNSVGGVSIGGFVDGNAIRGNSGPGVHITLESFSNTAYGNTIAANGIGNQVGVLIDGASFQNSVGLPSFVPGIAPGNVISGNGVGVSIRDFGTRENVVQGNLIGLEAGTDAILANQVGIEISNAADNTIGGGGVGGGNVVSGNTDAGISIEGFGGGNIVSGNSIGISSTGVIRPNGGPGIRILGGADSNRVGGFRFVEEGNVIGGNLGAGILIEDSSSIIILGNNIGTNAAGTVAVPNAGAGIRITGASEFNSIGGSISGVADDSNLISGNSGPGIELSGAGVRATTVTGNRIGLDFALGSALGNAVAGILIEDSLENTIGGTVSVIGQASGNVISANPVGILLTGAGATSNVIVGNIVGASGDGLVSLGNTSGGIRLEDSASFNTIGGHDGSDGVVDGRVLGRNLISGNGVGGVIQTSSATSNHVLGNLIGSDITGGAPLGNLGSGIGIEAGAASIGGREPGAGNIIAFNSGAGLRIEDPALSAASIVLRNRFNDNGGLAIDLGPAGSTPNDPGDLDGILNAPVISSTSLRGSTLTIRGFAPAGREIEFYLAAPDPSGFGEGTRFLGVFREGSSDDRDSGFGSYSSPFRGFNVGADSTTRFEFVFLVPDDVVEGTEITAIAVGSVSESAANIFADAGPPFGSPVVDAGADATLVEKFPFATQGSFTDLDSDLWTAEVDYGDGSGFVPLAINPITFQEVGDEYVRTATATFDLEHVYESPGTYIVRVRVIDDSGLAGEDTLVVTVLGTPPRLENSSISIAPSTIFEGESVTVSGEFEDASGLDTHIVRIVWGDGSVSDAIVDQVNDTFTATHTYLDDKPNNTIEDTYALEVIVIDSASSIARSTLGLFYVQVLNVQPSDVIVSLTPSDLEEGSGAVTLGATFVDPGIIDSHRVEIDWGDGSPVTVLTLAPGVTAFGGVTHFYVDQPADGAEYTIRVAIGDDDDPLRPTVAEVFATVTDSPVTNLAVGLDRPSITEGGSVELSGGFDDPGIHDRHIVEVDWGDGSSPTRFELPRGARTFSGLRHTYIDDDPSGTTSDPYLIRVSVVDPDAPASPAAIATTSLVVTNAAPGISGIVIKKADGGPLAPSGDPTTVGKISENDEVIITGSILDVGSRDTHTVLISWGDGSLPVFATVDPLTRTFSARHRFLDDAPDGTSIDPATIRVSVTDDDLSATSIATTILIENVAPTVSIAAGVGSTSTTMVLHAEGDDASPLDLAALRYRWTITQIEASGATSVFASSTFSTSPDFSFNPDPAKPTARYSARVEVADDDLGVGSTTSQVVLLDDDANDFDVAPAFVLPSISTLVIFGLAGEDAIDASLSPVPVFIDGGADADVIVASPFDDVILLHDGDDSVSDPGGNDRFRLRPNSTLSIVDGSGSNTIDFELADFGVTFDLAATSGEMQDVGVGSDPGRHFVQVDDLGTGRFDNLIGSAFGDTFRAASGTTIDGGRGSDRFELSTVGKPLDFMLSNITLRGGADADTFVIQGSRIDSIDLRGDDGADTFVNQGTVGGTIVFSGGADGDILTNVGTIDRIDFRGDDGLDEFVNQGTITTIVFGGGADADLLTNQASVGTIDFRGDDGADELVNAGTITTITFGGGADADLLTNTGNVGTIDFKGDDGLDTFTNERMVDRIIFSGGADADLLINIGGVETIDFAGDDGLDALENRGTVDTIVFSGGADQDLLVNRGTIEMVDFRGDDGADVFRNEGGGNVLGTIIFTGGADSDLLQNSGTLGTIDFNGDDGADELINQGTSTTIIFTGGADADTFINLGSAGTIDFQGDDGIDSFVNRDGATIDRIVFTGGADADLLENRGTIELVDFKGDDGIDELINRSSIDTIIFLGGADADRLVNAGTVVELIDFRGDDGADDLINVGTVERIDFGGGADTDRFLNGAFVANSFLAGTVLGSVLFRGGRDADTLSNPGTIGGTIEFEGDDGIDTLVNTGSVDRIIFDGGADADVLINRGVVSNESGGVDSIIFRGGADVDRLINEFTVASIRFEGDAGAAPGTGGGDELRNRADDVGSIVFLGDDGADLLVNEGDRVGKIDFQGDDGVDVLTNLGAGVERIIFTGGADADTLINRGAGGSVVTTIDFGGGADADILINDGSGPIVIDFRGDDGADTLFNTGSDLTSIIFTGGGDVDTLANRGGGIDSIIFIGGADTDLLGNSGHDILRVEFQGDDGADTLENLGSIETIVFTGGADADTLVNSGNVGTIDFQGDAGDDGITNIAVGSIDQLLFNGGLGNDRLGNIGVIELATVFGEAGNDEVINAGDIETLRIDGGDDDDRFSNSATVDGELLLGRILISIEFSGGAGNDELRNRGSFLGSALFLGDSGDDRLYNQGPAVGTLEFRGDDGADLLANDGEASRIVFVGGADADTLWNFSTVEAIEFQGDSGADQLINRGREIQRVEFNGGDDADLLENHGSEIVDIIFLGGADADILANNGSHIEKISFQGGDGGDQFLNNGSTIGLVEFFGGSDSDMLINRGDAVGRLEMDGGDGADLLRQLAAGVRSLVFVGGNGGDGLHAAGDDFDSIRFEGGPGADSFSFLAEGSQSSVVDFLGDSGNDVAILLGSAYSIRLDGGTDHDRFLFESDARGAFDVAGGIGDDSYEFVGSPVIQVVITESSTAVGSDTLDFSSFSAGGITIDLSSSATMHLPGGATLTSTDPEGLENVVGTVFPDVILGNAQANHLAGSAVVDDRLASPGSLGEPERRTQWVLLDFDTFTDRAAETGPAEHVYTEAERQAILQRIASLYHGPDPLERWFDFEFTSREEQIPAELRDSGRFATLFFNRTPSFNRPGGEASEIDFRNTNLGGWAAIQINGLVGGVNQPAKTSENIIRLASKIAAHELAHLAGVRHVDSFGPIGLGSHNPPGGSESKPEFGGPDAAYLTFDHLISSPATVGSDRFNDLRDLYFGPRESIKLAYAEKGIPVEESNAGGTIALPEPLALEVGKLQAEPIVLQPLAVPNAVPTGRDAGKRFQVGAAAVLGRIDIDALTRRSEDDVYVIEGRRGDLLNLEIHSMLLVAHQGAPRIDSVLRVYDQSGSLVPYYGGTAVNDDQFEPTDSVILDLVLPNDGLYFIVVDTFKRNPDDPIFDPSNPESPLYPDNVRSRINPLNAQFDAELRDQFLDTRYDVDQGAYELFLYRFSAAGIDDQDDWIEGREGDDVLLGGQGTDNLIGGFGRDRVESGEGGPGYELYLDSHVDPEQLAPGRTLTLIVQHDDPSGSEYWDLSVDFGDAVVTRRFTTSTISLDHIYTSPAVYTIRLSLANDDGLTASMEHRVVVADGAPPSLASIPDQVVDELSELVVDLEVEDPDADDSFEFTLIGPDHGARIDSETHQLIWTPSEAQGPGRFEFTVRVTDDDGLFDERSFSVDVLEKPTPPTLEPIAPIDAEEGDVVRFLAVGADVDLPNRLFYSLDGAPEGASIDRDSGDFQWVAARSNSSIVEFFVVVTDDTGLSASRKVTIHVETREPIIAITGPLSGTTIQVGIPTLVGGRIDNPRVGGIYQTRWYFTAQDATTPTIISTATVQAQNSEPLAFSSNVVFVSVGIFGIRLEIVDVATGATATTTSLDDSAGGGPARLIAYNPLAGYVVGAGGLNVPPGAFTASPNLGGLVSFEIESRYVGNSVVPTGKTTIRLSRTNFTFASTSLQWMIVDGSTARYRGIGTVNGSGEFGFEISVVDGGLRTPAVRDRIRIVINDLASGSTVFDNHPGLPPSAEPTEQIRTGQIRIQPALQAQRLAGGATTRFVGSLLESDAQLAPIVEAAIARWAAAGLDPQRIERLRAVDFEIAELGGNLLGLSYHETVWIDRNAAGAGWFIDPTPSRDEEFLPRTASRRPRGVDLVSVVAHELGHVLGLDDQDARSGARRIMNGRISEGARRTPRVIDVEGTTAAEPTPSKIEIVSRRTHPRGPASLRSAASSARPDLGTGFNEPKGRSAAIPESRSTPASNNVAWRRRLSLLLRERGR